MWLARGGACCGRCRRRSSPQTQVGARRRDSSSNGIAQVLCGVSTALWNAVGLSSPGGAALTQLACFALAWPYLLCRVNKVLKSIRHLIYFAALVPNNFAGLPESSVSLMFAAEEWTTTADGTAALSVSLTVNVKYAPTCSTPRYGKQAQACTAPERAPCRTRRQHPCVVKWLAHSSAGFIA